MCGVLLLPPPPRTSSRRAQTTFNLPLTSQGIGKEVGNVLVTFSVQTCRSIFFVFFVLEYVIFLRPRICHSGEVRNGSGIIRCTVLYETSPLVWQIQYI